MKKLTILLLVILPFIAMSQSDDSTWFRKNYVKREFYIPMRDGVKLFTSVYLPENKNEKHPILMTRTPYSAAPYGNDFRPFWKNHYREYLKENYIMVIQDVRGRWMSEGKFVDVRPYNPNKKAGDIDESTDTYDTVDWLIKNLENNNGNVGVFGISYPGFYSTMAALSQHPAVKAVSPQAPVTEWFLGDDFHHNGAFFQMDAFAFYSGFGKPRPTPTTVGPAGFKYPTNDNYEFYLRTGAVSNLTKLMGDSIEFWKDLMAHPNYDAFWKARNTRNFVNNIPSATNTLVVGGLFDAEDCFGAWNLYKAIEQKSKNNNKLVMGPWFHGQWASTDGTHLGHVEFNSNTSEWYAKNIEIPYFNYYLKNKGSLSLPEATVFFSGENNWKQFNQWPPAEMKEKNIYLLPNGKLGWNKAADANSFSEYISDPSKPVPYTEDVHVGRTREYMTDDQRFASRRPDVVVFTTDELTEDLTLAGPVIADLMVSITGTDADFVVKLVDVFPDDISYNNNSRYLMSGYQMLVRGEIMRGKFRNSFEKPEPFVPNKVTPVRFTLPDVAHTFKKGHKLMVQVQSSWFPLVDRNPQQFMNIYEAKNSDFKKATIRIFHNATQTSKIILPVVQ